MIKVANKPFWPIGYLIYSSVSDANIHNVISNASNA